ncbi:MAG: DUF4349 domain-containing protein [Tepidanaerobacteraceae bacterium]|nr:DUF4349 domain-containing protein [Tepidanaerobacteraceae bacterium]
MACKTYENLIDKYIEGLVTNEEKAILDEHLEVCPDCRQEVQELQQIIKTANSLGQVELPPDFAQSLMEKINSISSEQKPLSKSNHLIGLIKDIPALLLNFYYQHKRAFIAVAGTFLIGIFVATVYNLGNSNMNFATKSARDEATQESAPAAESPMMNDDVRMFSQEQGKNEIFGAAADLRGGGQKLKNLSTEERSDKIIKNADMSIYVENFDKKVDDIINLVNNLGGYIENSEISGANSADSSRRAHMALRIPQAELTKALDEFKAMGRIRSQRLGGENITEAYYDTSARVYNLKQQEQRLLEILKMAKNVDEVLRIENELNRVRTDIDVLTGQLTAWDKMVEMSLVNLNLIEQEPSKEKLGMVTLSELARRCKQGFIATINFSLSILATLAEVIGALLPVAIIAGLLYKCIHLLFKGFANRKKKN